MNIRDIEPELLRRLKINAANEGISLKLYVVSELEKLVNGPTYVVMEGKKLRMTKTPPAESIEVVASQQTGHHPSCKCDRCHPKEAKSARRN